MAKGVAWTVLYRLVGRGLSLVSTIVLARLLLPEAFGIVAMASSIIAALELMGYFSFDIMLIQKQDANRKDYDTAWTFNVLFGILAAAGICAMAGPAASFYSEPRLIAVMYALALGTAIYGFENIGIVAFRKEMRFDRDFAFVVLKQLSGFLVTIPLAFMLRSYWALVIGMVAMRTSGVVASFLMHPFRPRFSLGSAGELFRFSKWILLNNILQFIWLRSADFVIGRTAGTRQLGLFAISFEIANLPTSELSAPINRAVFPGYALMSYDLSVLRQGYLNVVSLIAILALPIGFGLSAVAFPLVNVFLGANWHAAAPLIALLAIYGTTNAMLTNTGTVFLAIGKPRYITILAALRITMLLPALIWATMKFGVIGAAWAYVVVALCFMPAIYLLAFRCIELNVVQFLNELWRPALATLAMYLCVRGYLGWVDYAPGALSGMIELFSAVAVGVFVYTVVLISLWWSAGRPNGAEQIIRDKVTTRLRRPMFSGTNKT